MKNYKSLLAAGILTSASAFVANQASAAQCTISVTQVSIDEGANLLISATGTASLTQNAICNFNGTVGSARPINPKSCEKWHNTFLTALLSGRSLEVFFTGSCPTVSPWVNVYTSSNQLYYVGIR